MNHHTPTQKRPAYRVAPNLDGCGYNILDRYDVAICTCYRGERKHDDADYENATFFCRCLNQALSHYPTLSE